jgi:putative Holliday junction resolvase
MPILGIDYGAKKIGLAKSDEQNKFALPLEIIKSGDRETALKRLREVCRQEEIEKIVVGVPIALQAEKRENLFRLKDLQNKQMREVLAFVDWLKANLELPIEVEDERLSSKLANVLGRQQIKKGDDDAVAAMLILQTYLDRISNN